MSLYSVIKPPKYGNCTVFEQTLPQILISLQELKDIYGAKSQGKSVQYRQRIKEELDEILRHHDWEADDVIEYTNYEHDYAVAETLDCIIYYVTGFKFNKLFS